MAELVYDNSGRLLFTKEMKEEYTILMPQMLPIHFGMFKKMLQLEGYHVEQLNQPGPGRGGRGTEIRPQRHLLPRSAGHRPVPGRHQERGLRPPQGGPVHHPRPAAAAGPATTSTCCAKLWPRRAWSTSR